MDNENVRLPIFWEQLCIISSLISIGISVYGIINHILQYRKPIEQRLVIRILIIVPLFSITCLIATLYPRFAQLYTDPIREVYEAFTIFAFFSLLILLLGGERHIVTQLTLHHGPVKHPVYILRKILPDLDLSDPSDLLLVKRGVMQYVWFKPIYCLCTLLLEIWSFPKLKFILILIYNASVTTSLYSLALFWKCLAHELIPFNPWPKFLCVKLIIFASYWQGIILQLLVYFGILNNGNSGYQAYVLQNAILCIEMIFFSLFHLIAFPWKPYSPKAMPSSAKMKPLYAIRDCFGSYDVLWDFMHAFFFGSSYYTYRNFETHNVESSLISNMNAYSRLRQLERGIRFKNNGTDKYWVNEYGSIPNSQSNSIDTIGNNNLNTDDLESGNNSFEDDISIGWDDSLGTQSFIPEDPNYPVIWDVDGYRYSNNIHTIRAIIDGKHDQQDNIVANF
ncbi:hypothetical protein Kpol_448p17 [Vanderwaltozyma polyspora DSM 70294]|uniref:DUF300-domain-containing protein n=1 Tax=Vanderwaltozyma polyspora (strain ATCC 22028 / DSM 70294 / BCRC 21397 / CBS 2163 / NBRC 10782 / NRRL Y-8283 / UCD 57-17) TaxID=436907 RepID=A7TQZ2_VANPO|nr:uncharacterized protein Kpol_448p17 [Vanderwaltozyma polyspora DSM 70294]EDO15329.1 hypothetical protein Kpol_448p17 [Vanderwaltozyma polyspora DSM 70294]